MELDVLDSKLIYALDFDARASLSSLARHLRVSKQVVKYRLDNLIKRGVIEGFYADINASKLGLSIYLVYIKFHHLSPSEEKKFINHLSQQESVGVSVSVNGKWDYCLGIWAENVVVFRRQYQQIMRVYEQFVRSKTVMVETDFYYFKPKQILDKEEDVQITMSGDIQKVLIDDQDRRILSELSKDARISLTVLGAKTGMTANSVKNRMKVLEKKRIIMGYRVMINYSLLGYLHYRVFLHLENLTEFQERSIIEFLKQERSALSVTKTIGYSEIEFRAVVKGVQELYELMNRIKNQFPDNIKETESILYHMFHSTLNYFPFLT